MRDQMNVGGGADTAKTDGTNPGATQQQCVRVIPKRGLTVDHAGVRKRWNWQLTAINYRCVNLRQ